MASPEDGQRVLAGANSHPVGLIPERLQDAQRPPILAAIANLTKRPIIDVNLDTVQTPGEKNPAYWPARPSARAGCCFRTLRTLRRNDFSASSSCARHRRLNSTSS